MTFRFPFRASAFCGAFMLLFMTQAEMSFAQGTYGDAVQLSCNCYRLTEEIGFQGGFVWSNGEISLNNPFDYTFDVNLGDIPGGADGIAFVLQPVGTGAGTAGGGLGYEGIVPSVAMAIDTYNNGALHGDIVADHVAIMANGTVDHNTADNLAGPTIALVSGMDIEDGQWHLMRVSWDPIAMVINFYMDGSLRVSYTGDIITNIFLNDPMVYWGFTGSTGSLFNEQQFCFSIIPGLSASELDICEGETIDFNDDSYSALGGVVSWDWTFGNGESSTDQAPGEVEFSQAGTYWVTQTIVDVQGCDASDSLQITVHPNPTASFTSTEVCEGEETDFQSTSVGTVNEWAWDFGDGETETGSSTSHVLVGAGMHEVELSIVTNQGCVDTVSNIITVFENPTASATEEIVSFNVTFSANLLPGEDAEWIILDTSYVGMNPFSYAFPDSGWYDVALIVMNENGCTDTLLYSIYVEGLPEYEMPNVFTPNGDDVNELFQPYTYSMIEANMKIFNRWGRPVYKYEGPIPPSNLWGWDGTVNGGAKAATGTYYYVLNLKGIDGVDYLDQGTVTLLR
ncbi:MAG: gliding motility-associated C-terminal domain-containing protein [Flavobacteriales bacterium]|nr:gliding motility-associated C-terminal domain-containing protein [Flavobacteriales bacterium]